MEDGTRIVPTFLAIAKDPAGAKIRAAKAHVIVRQRQKVVMVALATSLKKAQCA